MKWTAEKGVMPAGLVGLPLVIWGVHFLLSYIVAAVYCAKGNDVAAAILSIRWIVLAVTIIAIAAIGIALRQGHRRYWLNASEHVPNSSAQPNQSRFFWTVLQMISALSAFAIICIASVTLFFGDCQ